MEVGERIEAYISGQPGSRRDDLRSLHQAILGIAPGVKLWFSDGRNEDGKVVANPSIGYGSHTVRYANGKTRESFRVGLSANGSGLSVYVIGLDDKRYLSEACGARLGKAKVTGYCIKFRHLKDISVGVIEEIIARHLAVAPA